jgi:hypothetical protein
VAGHSTFSIDHAGLAAVNSIAKRIAFTIALEL